MMISKMIEKLRHIESMHGDLPVFMSHDYDDKDFYCHEVMQIQANHFLRWNATKMMVDNLNSVVVLYGQEDKDEN